MWQYLEDKKQHIFTWNIENFSSCSEEKDFELESPIFVAESLNRTTWYLSLFPRGEVDATNGYLSLFLNRSEDDEGPQEIKCEYKLELIHADNKPFMSEKASDKFKKGDSWGWSNFLKNEQLFKAGVSEDTVTIICCLTGSIPKTTRVSENVDVTRIGIDHCTFMWTISNLNSSCSEVMKFSSSGASQIEISIQVPEDDIKIDIRRVEGFSGSQSVKCKIALLDVKGEEQDSRRSEHLFEPEDSREALLSAQDRNDTWEFPIFIKKSKLNSEESKYLKNDSFTLLCEVSVSNGKTSEIIREKKWDSSFRKAAAFSIDDTVAVLEDLKRMYISKIETDVKLHADNRVFLAHKCILSSRSPVFLAMFEKDMTESQTDCVDIPDLEAKTVELLLEFLYTGKVEYLDYDIALKLMIAADKYQVLSLKEKCAEFLPSVMSDINVCNILVIADLVQHESLKTSAVRYIKEHSENVLVSEEWTLCLENNLKLATETVRKVSALLAVESKRDFSA